MSKNKAPFSTMYVFGDSLSDTGNIHDLFDVLLTDPLPSADAGFSEKYTNIEQFGDGEMWVETATRLLDLDRVENFAFGGARALGESTAAFNVTRRDLDFLLPEDVSVEDLNLEFDGDTLSPEALARLPEDVRKSFAAVNDVWLTGQVTNALAQIEAEGGPAPGSAATFFIGGNDFNAFNPAEQTPQDFITAVIRSIVENAQRVAASGVETLVYVTQPSLTVAPVSEVFVSRLEAQITAQLIDAGVDPEQAAIQARAQAQGTLAQFDQLVDVLVEQVTAGFNAIGEALGTNIVIVEQARLSAAIDADRSAFGFAEGVQARIIGSGTTPEDFIDLNGNGIPDTEIDPVTGEVLAELELEFRPIGRDGQGQPTAYNIIDPRSAGIDDDELVFYDFFHPTAAAHDIIGAFYDASVRGVVTFLEEERDIFRGTTGEDVVFALGGDDDVRLGRGDDVVFAGTGNDVVLGGRGKDLVVGGAGDDVVIGGRGADLVAGSDGNDQVFGGGGHDVVLGGRGNDSVFGERGNDVFVFNLQSDLSEQNTVSGGRGHDVLFIEVSGADAAAAHAALDGFEAGRNFTFELGTSSIAIRGVEEIIIGDKGDPFAAQAAYETAFRFTGPNTSDVLETAALWNVADPVFGDLG